MFCPNCGNELKEGTAFCGKCGAAQQVDNTTPLPVGNQNVFPNATPVSASVATNKKMKKVPIIIIGIVVLIVILIVLLANAFGNSISVKDVKEGYLTYFSESKTIGSAFDNYTYFDDISWEEFDGEKDNGEKASVVEFNATIVMDNVDSYTDSYAADYAYETLTVQFYTNDDMDSNEFEIYGIWFSDVDNEGTDICLDDYDFEDILDCIYADEMFILIPSDYGLYYS